MIKQRSRKASRPRLANRAPGDDYLDLVRQFPLRPLRNQVEYDRAIVVLKELVSRADRPGLSSGESDYADALGHFIDLHEAAHHAVERDLHTPLERLRYLMREHGMTSADLGRLLGSGSGNASLILHGKRELSKANIRALGAHFRVSPALFI